MRQIINATGTDVITLWEYDEGRITRRKYSFHPWIFVSGSEYDLERLSGELDLVRGISYMYTTRRNVYGQLHGLEITMRQSQIMGIIDAIGVIGSSRKLSAYNAGINQHLRFMSERGLSFFGTGSRYDTDPEIPSVVIGGKTDFSGLTSISIDGKEMAPTGTSFSDVAEAINNSTIILYSNSRLVFQKILNRISGMGYRLPYYRAGSESSYESYGRVMHKSPEISMPGKICISSDSFIYSESGLAGLYEVSRMSSLPIVLASRVTPGTAVSSLEVSHAIKNGILVPLYKDDHEKEKPAAGLFERDKGGIVLQPDPGIYENVTEIDFSSMYPSIIVRYNLSPETIGMDGGAALPGSGYRVDAGKKGFLPSALGELLDRRLMYKSIREGNPVIQKRDAALKWMLLTSFGYTGYKNAKFGRIEVHEAITAIGRWAFSTAMKLAEKHGFHVIHGIVDSLWLSGDGDMGDLLKEIREKTRIDIVVDDEYSWIAFFKGKNGLGSPGRYLGRRRDGTFKVRGLEIRRNDFPAFAKRFQVEALDIFRACKNRDDVLSMSGELKALEKKYLREMTSFDLYDFALETRVSRHMEEYRVNNLQRATMKFFSSSGDDIMPGESVSVVVSDRKHGVVQLPERTTGIDRNFYLRYLKRSFESFDFLVSSARGNQVILPC
ncbi:DNA polymerase [Thermoplasmatales archaeon]|nr:DNA polymerase [Thermoplasmatales archaeon]